VNGAQDVGGMTSFGPVQPEPNEPIFHAAFEPRVLANVLAIGALGLWSGDASRFARESLPPPFYYTRSYYEIWLAGLEKLLAEKHLVSEDEIAAGRALHDLQDMPLKVFRAEKVTPALARGWPSDRPANNQPRFAVGHRVRMKNVNPPTHTRLPRYTRGKTGIVEKVRGCFVYPDTSAHGAGEDPQWCYNVRFSARELWGEDADPKISVSIDAFEPYLEGL
jgi:nitrile hydratase subunit beta